MNNSLLAPMPHDDDVTLPSWVLPPKTPQKAVIVGAESAAVMEAVLWASTHNFIDPLLVGNKQKIHHLADQLSWDINNISCYYSDDTMDEAALGAMAATIAKEQHCAMAIKGSIHSNYYLKSFLSSKAGFKTDSVASHFFVMSGAPLQKPVIITDAAFNIAPSLDMRQHIVANAIKACEYLSIANPVIACLSASEIVMDAMPSSHDAAMMARWINDNYHGTAEAFGPVAIDLALSHEAAIIKNYANPLAGYSDIILAPNIEVGNAIFKLMVYLNNMQAAGIVTGLTIPLVLTSRADSLASRCSSIALASMSSAT